MTRQITVTEHLLLHEKRSPEATGRFTSLMNNLVLAGKIISREVNKAGLVDVLGATGEVNVQGERVQKLDEYANSILIHRMERTGVLCAMASEENADLIHVSDRYPQGEYILVFDPLDGSSNIDANVNIGTIFSVLRRTSPSDEPVTLCDVLCKGTEQLAAGYILYGSSTMLVYTTGNGVNGFTLDPSVGEFLLSHENIRTPSRGKIYSVNEGYQHYWDQATSEVVDYFKNPDSGKGKPYSGRYIGSLVADFHRNLLYGGVFMYPMDRRDPKKPKGKLRLLCEAFPMAFVAEQAGGMAIDGERRILDIEPEELHQRTPLFVGSPEDVEQVRNIYDKYR